MKPTILVQHRMVYGKPLTYPVNQLGKLACDLLQKKTLDSREIGLLESMGFQVEWLPQGEPIGPTLDKLPEAPDLPLKVAKLQTALSKLSYHNAAEGADYRAEKDARIEARHDVMKCAREVWQAGGNPRDILSSRSYLVDVQDLGFYTLA